MILGLTGGIASGKSTVSQHLREIGIPIVDADEISHSVTKKNGEGAKAILRVFGEDFFVNGELNRRALAQFCFASKEKTMQLNSLLHPIICAETDKQLDEYRAFPVTVLDAPLLLEAGLNKRCHKTAVVVCDTETRIRRAMLRSEINEAEVRSRIERQMSDSERIKYADYIIDNNGALEETLRQADKIIDGILHS